MATIKSKAIIVIACQILVLFSCNNALQVKAEGESKTNIERNYDSDSKDFVCVTSNGNVSTDSTLFREHYTFYSSKSGMNYTIAFKVWDMFGHKTYMDNVEKDLKNAKFKDVKFWREPGILY